MERFLKTGIAGQRFETAQLAQVSDPLLPYRLGDRSRQIRIRLQQPTSWSNSVCLVAEAIGKHFSQILHGPGAQQSRMNSSYTLCAVRADDCKIGHTDFA